MSAPFNSPNSTARVPGTPLPRGNVSVQAPNVPIPRICGVVDSEAWVGGSNIAPLPMAIHFGQRRPLDYKNAFTVQQTCKAGIEEKLGKVIEKNDFAFTLWVGKLKKRIEENGMDTVFRVPDSTWTSEIYILEDWGKAQMDLVTPWVINIMFKAIIDLHLPVPMKNRHWNG